MRESKFRGFSKESEKWIYGVGVAEVNGVTVMLSGDMPNTFTKEVYGVATIVESNSTGEFIGLHEFVNSEEIYEGDIFQHPDSKETFVIAWSDADLGFMAKYANDITSIPMQIDPERGAAILIGNIYENPELLCTQ